ncbi:DNA recombination protein RmuC [Roseobacter sp. HKCCA0434]|uniref:DNA recombination protein RmuC n=1 Tax=Roseobacter sp. HKCCA0434 TaxID=3079297 RepID=UPI00290582F3|nr:DNA recombination protein RmuC [Roseobacter sp. HKCCA0434]
MDELLLRAQALTAQYTWLTAWWMIAAVALLLGWLLRGLVSVRRLRRSVATLRQEVDGHRAAAEEAATARQAQATDFARLQERAAYLDTLSAKVDALDEARRTAESRAASLAAALTAERDNHAARLAELDQRFDGLARKVLEGNSQRFLATVTERFATHKETADADLAARQQGIEALLQPIRENLARFERQTQEMEKAREGAYHQIRQQVATLAEGQHRLTSETQRLVTALRRPKTRGNWGEFQLRQVVEMAGMVDHVDFHMERAIEVDGQSRRPDAIVRLPGDKRIVIDVKTNLEAYLDAIEMEEGAEKDAVLANHARQLRDQMKALSQKAYFEAVAGSPDFVVLFVPGEAFYSAALTSDPALIEDALARNVLIASPTTLIALLKSASYGWQQERMGASAQAAIDNAQELYNRFSVLGDKLGKLGKSISNTVRDYNATIGSAERNLLPQARKFEALSIAPAGKSIEPLDMLETEVREITAAELRDGD